MVRDGLGRVTRPIPADAKTEAEETGRSIVFRATAGTPGSQVVVTKTFRLMKGADGFELELRFESPDADRTLSYKILGPHGIPIEGEWYTSTFRDVFFGQISGTEIKVVTRAAATISPRRRTSPSGSCRSRWRSPGSRTSISPSFVEPSPLPDSVDDRWDAEAVPLVLHADADAPQKADVTVEITSKPLQGRPERADRRTPTRSSRDRRRSRH